MEFNFYNLREHPSLIMLNLSLNTGCVHVIFKSDSTLRFKN